MIVVDTSAVISVIRSEDTSEACVAAPCSNAPLLMSAGTMAECLIVSVRKNFLARTYEFIDGLGLEIVPVTEDVSRRIATIYSRFGKGFHPAALNYGDCL